MVKLFLNNALVQSPEKGEAIEIKFNEKGFNPAKYRKFLEAYPEYNMSCRAFIAQDNKQSLLAL